MVKCCPLLETEQPCSAPMSEGLICNNQESMNGHVIFCFGFSEYKSLKMDGVGWKTFRYRRGLERSFPTRGEFTHRQKTWRYGPGVSRTRRLVLTSPRGSRAALNTKENLRANSLSETGPLGKPEPTPAPGPRPPPEDVSCAPAPALWHCDSGDQDAAHPGCARSSPRCRLCRL